MRVKINGKGPFNFIVDTGCPVLLIAEPVGKKVGLKIDKGWSMLDKLELEGGLELTKVKARVETPFQITGMNGMGLAGVELHGLMGYTVLAKFKMEFDYTKKQMTWTPLAFEPPPPRRSEARRHGGHGHDGGPRRIPELFRRRRPGPAARNRAASSASSSSEKDKAGLRRQGASRKAPPPRPA